MRDSCFVANALLGLSGDQLYDMARTWARTAPPSISGLPQVHRMEHGWFVHSMGGVWLPYRLGRP
jgi:glyoxylate utilization-related uncharacterized protein